MISWLAAGLTLLRPFIGDDGAASLEADDERDPLDFDLERDTRNEGDVGFDALDDDDELEAEEPGLESSLSIGVYPMYAANLNDHYRRFNGHWCDACSSRTSMNCT